MLSIIIATYNVEHNIRRALESVLRLGDVDFECIIIDGGSTDRTLEVVESVAGFDPRVSLSSEKDDGIFDAINKGVLLAKGNWIYVMGADDEIIPSGLESLVKSAGEFDVVYGHTVDRFVNGKLRYPRSKSFHLVKKNMFCSHQGLIMRRDLIVELGGFRTEYPLKADFDLLQRAYLNGARFRMIDVLVAFFSMEGVSSNASIFQERERYRILKANKSISLPLFYIFYLAIRKLLKRCFISIFIRIK